MKEIIYIVQEKINDNLWIPRTKRISDESDAIAVMRCLQFDNSEMGLRILKVTTIKEVISLTFKQFTKSRGIRKMVDNIETVEYIRIPLSNYAEIQSYIPGNILRAIKYLRYSQANVGNEDGGFCLMECKRIIDWISNHPDDLHIGSEAVFIPVSILQ